MQSARGRAVITTRELLIFLSTILYFIYPYFMGMKDRIYGGENGAIISLILSMVLLAMVGIKQTRSIRLHTGELLWLLALVAILFWRNADLKNNQIGRFIYFSVAVLTMAIGRFSQIRLRIGVKIILWLSVFFAFCTVWFYFDSAFYLSKIVPLFEEKYHRFLRSTYANGYMAGLTAHYSANGIYLSFGFGIALITAFYHRTNRMYLLAMFIGVALFLTAKRGPILFVVMSLAFVFGVYKSGNMLQRMLRILGLVLILFISLLVLSQFLPGLMGVVDRFIEPAETGADITSSRSVMWGIALQFFQKNPILGIGWGRYKYEFLALFPRRTLTIQTHNIYLQLLCETGVIGFIFFSCIILYSFFVCYSLYNKSRLQQIATTRDDDYLLGVSLFCQTFFILYGLTGNPLYDAQVYFIYMFACGIAFLYAAKFRKRKRYKDRFV